MKKMKIIGCMTVGAILAVSAFTYVYASLDSALQDIAGLAEKYAIEHNGLFPETGVAVYCRGGGRLADSDSVFSTLGFKPSLVLPANANLCFNVSQDRMKVAISASTSPLDNQVKCLKVDAVGDQPNRAPVIETDSCLP